MHLRPFLLGGLVVCLLATAAAAPKAQPASKAGDSPPARASAPAGHGKNLERELRQTTARALFNEGQNLIEKDVVGPAFAYFLRAARINAEDPTPLQRLVGLTLYRTLPTVYGQTRHDEECLDALFRPDGGAFVSTGADGTVQFCDVKTGQSRTLTRRAAGPILALAMSASQFATGATGGHVQRWNAHTGEPVGEPIALEIPVARLAYSPDGKTIAAALVDGQLVLLSAETGAPGARVALDNRIAGLFVLPDGKVLALAGARLHRRAAGTLAESTPPLELEGVASTLAITANGQRAATALGRATSIWDLAAGKRLSGPFEQPGEVQALDFDPAGERIVVGDSSGLAMIWNAATGKALSGAMNHLSPVVRVKFSPHGLRVATGTFRGNAAVWSALRGERLTIRMSYAETITSLDWSPDGYYLAASSADGSARAWDVRSGVAMSEPLSTTGGLAHVAFLADREIALVSAPDQQSFTLRELLSGRLLGPEVRLDSPFTQATFSDDGRWLAIVREIPDGLQLQIHETASARLIGSPFRVPGKEGRVTVTFSADGRFVLVPAGDEVLVCDTARGRPLPLPLKLSAAVSAAAFSHDGKLVFAGAEDGSARLWRLPTGDPVGPPIQHQGRIFSGAFSRNGALLAIGSADQSASLWRTANGQRARAPFALESPVQAVAFSHDGARLAAGSADGKVRVFTVADGRLRAGPLDHESAVWRLEFGPDRHWLQVGFGVDASDRRLRVWNADTSSPYRLPPGVLNAFRFDPGVDRLLAAYAHGRAYLFSSATGKISGSQLQHGSSIADAVFSLDGRQVATASWDSTARVWDPATRTPLSDSLDHGGPVTELRFSKDGERLITVETDEFVRAWELGPFRTPPPPWVDELITGESGFEIDPDGQLTPVLSDRMAVRKKIETMLAGEPRDAWERWGKWMFADLIDSPISPNSTIPVRAHLERRIAATETLEELDVLTLRCVGDQKLLRLVQDRRQQLQSPQ